MPLDIVKVELFEKNIICIRNRYDTLFIDMELDVNDPGSKELLRFMDGKPVKYFYADVDPPDFNLRVERFPKGQDW